MQASSARPQGSEAHRVKDVLGPEVTGDGGGYLVEREARSEKHATDIDID